MERTVEQIQSDVEAVSQELGLLPGKLLSYTQEIDKFTQLIEQLEEKVALLDVLGQKDSKEHFNAVEDRKQAFSALRRYRTLVDEVRSRDSSLKLALRKLELEKGEAEGRRKRLLGERLQLHFKEAGEEIDSDMKRVLTLFLAKVAAGVGGQPSMIDIGRAIDQLQHSSLGAYHAHRQADEYFSGVKQQLLEQLISEETK